MKRPPVVEAEWFDARSVYEQIEVAHVADKVQLSQRFTVGYLVHRDRERVIIAGTFDPAEKKISKDDTPDADGAADFTVIPRSWVVKLRSATVEEEEEKHEDTPGPA